MRQGTQPQSPNVYRQAKMENCYSLTQDWKKGFKAECEIITFIVEGSVKLIFPPEKQE